VTARVGAPDKRCQQGHTGQYLENNVY